MSTINESNFEKIALSLFKFQAKENKVYRQYLTYLGVNVDQINNLVQIPFLPISLFKAHDVVTGEWNEEAIFYSSSTTGNIPSKHKVKSLDFYLKNAERIFKHFYGNLSDFHFYALLPSYLERNGSSLVAMAKFFIDMSNSPYSSFYLTNHEELYNQLSKTSSDGRCKILMGVSFALMDFAEANNLDLQDVIVMETGGMKGRREELTRGELHTHLRLRFNSKSIHSEYGMTELFSQAYSKGDGYFQSPPGMKIMVRGINDPFEPIETGKTGGINVIDLANIYTCAFVETQDLGRVWQDGSFEVLGRIDNSDSRGCNLLVG